MPATPALAHLQGLFLWLELPAIKESFLSLSIGVLERFPWSEP